MTSASRNVTAMPNAKPETPGPHLNRIDATVGPGAETLPSAAQISATII